MKRILAFAAILSVMTLQSCTTQTGTDNQTLNLEISGNYTLEFADGINLNEGFPTKVPTLILESISKKLTGNTGCNQMFGSFTTKQNKISFSEMGATKMFCEGVKENEYLALLNQVDSYKLNNNQLTFLNKEGKQILKYLK
mgnify:CR=1 FL=1